MFATALRSLVAFAIWNGAAALNPAIRLAGGAMQLIKPIFNLEVLCARPRLPRGRWGWVLFYRPSALLSRPSRAATTSDHLSFAFFVFLIVPMNLA